VLALNVVARLSCVLCGAGVYLLARRVGVSPLGAALAGIIFAFAPPRFFRLGQLHLTTIQWVPFCLAFVHAYLDSGRWRDLWWACGFFALQALTSGHGAVFAAVAIAALLVWRVALGEPILLARRLRDFGLPVARRVVPLLAQCCELSCVADASACVPAVAPRERAGSAGCQSISVPGLSDARARRDRLLVDRRSLADPLGCNVRSVATARADAR